MIYQIQKVDDKSEDWKVVTIVEGATANQVSANRYMNVSINRKNKKGEIFPNFDNIKEGNTVEGDIWQNDSGKWYLFAPRVSKQGNSGAFKQKMIEDTMNKKAESISHFQDSKENAVKTASTIRMAVDVATSLTPEQWQSTTMQEEIRFWREWFWAEWDNVKGAPPFND